MAVCARSVAASLWRQAGSIQALEGQSNQLWNRCVLFLSTSALKSVSSHSIREEVTSQSLKCHIPQQSDFVEWESVLSHETDAGAAGEGPRMQSRGEPCRGRHHSRLQARLWYPHSAVFHL